MKAAYNSKVSALEQADKDNAAELLALKNTYLAKVEELANADSANASALEELKTAYNNKVSALEKSIANNEKAIADLSSDYTMKVQALEESISSANAKIESNKTELNGAISTLTATYEEKMSEIDELLATLQNTDTTQDEKIVELANKITALEQATRITDIQFADNGDLIITFGDGSKQTVKAPEKHVHDFGDWTVFTDNDTPCENRLFFRTCSDCYSIEWKQGEYSDHDFTTVTTAPTCTEQGYDTKTCDICGKVETLNYTPTVPHPWATKYSEDNSYHWYDCTTCNAVKGKEEHTDDGSGNCSVCDYPIGPTAGIVYDVVDGKARVIMYEGTATRVRIAETYNGAPVTEIVHDAFSWNQDLTSITIPDSVTSIGGMAFAFCDNLSSVHITDIAAWCNISFEDYSANPLSSARNLYLNNELVTELVLPNTVTEIKAHAFEYWDNLISIVLPNSVTSIGEHAFNECNALKNITIPDSVIYINRSAFNGCANLKSEYNRIKYLKANGNPYYLLWEVNKNFSSYTIHPNTKIIGSYVFEGCSSLTSIEIPDGVTSIGEGAFAWCNNLKSVEIGDSVTSIGNYAFRGCNSLTSVVIGDSVTSIGEYAFEDCSSLTSVVIPDSVTSIGEYAFEDCSSLKSVVIGDSVTSIGEYAFWGCRSLTSVVIGDSVTSIGDNAFWGCDNLTSVYITDIAAWCNIWGLSNLMGYDGSSSKKLYLNNELITDLVIPDSVTSIDSSAFRNCSSLTSVVIGDSVTSISDWAFSGCSSLKSVVIGDGVTSINNYAFCDCSSLTSITFEDTSTWYTTTSSSDWENKTGGTQISVSDSSTNATYLTSSYSEHYWYKK